MKHQMDVEKAVAATGAEATRKMEIEKVIIPVRRYWLFLCIGSVVVAIAPRLAPASRPAFVPSVPAGYGLVPVWITCVTFTVATLVVQEMLARVLKPRPRPALRLTPESACQLGFATWMFLTMFFHSYLSFGGDDYFVRGCDEWWFACVASALNLFVVCKTVADYLA